MYKSKTLREISHRHNAASVKGNAGVGRLGADRKPAKVLLQAGIHNARWNTGKLPKGAHKKVNGVIGAQRTGR